MTSFNDLPIEIRIKIFKVARRNAFHNIIKKYESIQLVKPKYCIRDRFGSHKWIWSKNSKNYTNGRNWMTITIDEDIIRHSYGFHCKNSKLNTSCVWFNSNWKKTNDWNLETECYSTCSCILNTNIVT